MHEHDLDLIAALADGSLADQTEARALVGSCAECRAEYESQVRVLGLLAAAPTVSMNELEKAALHRDLWTELTTAPATAPSPPWWHRWSYVAAGLLVVVGLGGVLGGQILTGDESAETFSEIGSGLDSAAEEAGPFAAEDSAEEGGAESGATTTAAATAQTLPLPFTELAEQARAEDGDRSLGTMSLDEEVEQCLRRTGLEQHIVVDEIELDQTYLVVMPEDPEAEPTVTFVALADCEVVHVDG